VVDDRVEEREVPLVVRGLERVPHEFADADEVGPERLLDRCHVRRHLGLGPLLRVVVDADNHAAAVVVSGRRSRGGGEREHDGRKTPHAVAKRLAGPKPSKPNFTGKNHDITSIIVQ
jgi:hypothetical protein